MKTLKQIIADHLFDSKCDGLFNRERKCSCSHVNIMPCDNPSTHCIADIKTDYIEKPFNSSIENNACINNSTH